MTPHPAPFTISPPARPAGPIKLTAGMELERLTDPELVARVCEHHAAVRRALPYLTALLAKSAGFHRRRNPKLAALCEAGEALADRLELRMDQEERELFPALLAAGPLGGEVRGELDHLFRHHRRTRLDLARIRWLADDFAVPSWADLSHQTLMEELAALEREELAHVSLEETALAPRIVARCAA
jgi:iron-sulfur cluster repair protein YtfE (RIC family)